MLNLEIRFADESDIDVVYCLIKELAAYEKLTHEITATVDDLKNTLFSNNSNAEVILASCNNIPVAFSLFFHNYSTFQGKRGLYIEDLFVKPEYRNQGIGTTLFKFLDSLARTRECGRLEWLVLDGNDSAIKFYQSMGAQLQKNYMVYRINHNIHSANQEKTKELESY